MKKRKQINYEDIVEIGMSLIKDETDYLYECSTDSAKAQCAFRISGIIDFLSVLDDATIVNDSEDSEKLETELETEQTSKELEEESKLNDKWDKFLSNAQCSVIPLSEKELVNFLFSGLKE